MANKVRFGLKRVKYAIWDETNSTYGSFVDFPNAVNWSMTREGGDSTDFYADDGVCYTFAGTNGGYSADLEMARVTDQVRTDLLGEVADSGTGVTYEMGDAEPAKFAIAFETQGDAGPVGFVFFGCKAFRPEMTASTKSDSPEVNTDTLNIRISGESLPYLGESKPVIQGHIEKTADNTAKYNAFFAAVKVPTAVQG